MTEEGGRVDYATIVLPQYCPEIVPSRRTRESNNTLLQSHDGLKFGRSSSSQDLSSNKENLRRFDYVRLDFAPPPSQTALWRRDQEDYINLKEGEDVVSAARRHSDCYVNLKERYNIGGAPQTRPHSHCYVSESEGGEECDAPQRRPPSDCYVNLGANRQSDIHFVRRGSANIDNRSARAAHLGLSRWQSERTARGRRPSIERERAQHDYQNVRTAPPLQGRKELQTAAVDVLSRRSSMVSERNPTTGEYQNQLQEDGKQSRTSSPSPMLLSPDFCRGPRRHCSEVKSPPAHSYKVARSMSMMHREASGCVSRKPLPSFTSRKVDYENLWYLTPDAYQPGVEGYTSEDNCCSSDEEQSMQDKKTLWRSSTVSIGPDYYDHLFPMTGRSGSQHSSGSTSSSSLYLDSELEDRLSIISESVSVTSARVPEALDVVPRPSSQKRQESGSAIAKGTGNVAGGEEGNHLGRFRLRYIGQCPIDRSVFFN